MGTRFAGGKASLWAVIAMLCSLFVIMGFAGMRASGEDKKVWQAGTITDVKAHQPGPEDAQETKQYDISVKVGKKIYVVLYTAKPGQPEPLYYVGQA